MWHNNCGNLLGNEFNSPGMAQRSQVGQGLWCHCDFMSMHVSLPASITAQLLQDRLAQQEECLPSAPTAFQQTLGLGQAKITSPAPVGFTALHQRSWDWGRGLGQDSCFQQVIELLGTLHYCSTLEFLALLLSSALAGSCVTLEFKNRVLLRGRV